MITKVHLSEWQRQYILDSIHADILELLEWDRLLGDQDETKTRYVRKRYQRLAAFQHQLINHRLPGD